jgi:hypothetical protein
VQQLKKIAEGPCGNKKTRKKMKKINDAKVYC